MLDLLKVIQLSLAENELSKQLLLKSLTSTHEVFQRMDPVRLRCACKIMLPVVINSGDDALRRMGML